MSSHSKPSTMLIEAVQDLIKLLEEETPQVPETPSPDDMEPWRERIDLIDKAMLHIMNERVQCANRIGAIKKKLGLPVYVPSREEEVIRNVVAGNEGPLSDAAVRRLFERVIDETRSLERHKYQDPNQE